MISRLFFAFALVCASPLAAGGQVDDIVTAQAPPPGVVFEIATGETGALERLLPGLSADVARLRARHPALPIAVVTHGREQFALTAANKARYGEVQQRIHDLTGKDKVAVHVCGNHARLRGVAAEEFPSDVDVADSGPNAVRRYLARGFVRIILD